MKNKHLCSALVALRSLVNSRNVAIRNCHPRAGTDVLLKLRGDKTGDISVYDNNFVGAGTMCDRGPDVAESALTQWSNRMQP